MWFLWGVRGKKSIGGFAWPFFTTTSRRRAIHRNSDTKHVNGDARFSPCVGDSMTVDEVEIFFLNFQKNCVRSDDDDPLGARLKTALTAGGGGVAKSRRGRAGGESVSHGVSGEEPRRGELDEELDIFCGWVLKKSRRPSRECAILTMRINFGR